MDTNAAPESAASKAAPAASTFLRSTEVHTKEVDAEGGGADMARGTASVLPCLAEHLLTLNPTLTLTLTLDKIPSGPPALAGGFSAGKSGNQPRGLRCFIL